MYVYDSSVATNLFFTGEKKPCYCPLCNGELRHQRTVKTHLEAYLHGQSMGLSGDSDGDEGVFSTHYAEASFMAGPETGFSSLLQAENPGLLRSDSCEDVGNSDASDLMSDSVDLDSEQSEIGSVPLSSNEDNSDDPGPDEPIDVGEDKIKEFVLRTLISKVNHGWSREETMAQIRNFYEVLNDERIPHKNWQDVLKFLKTLGYQEPRHYKICCGDDHIRLLDYGTPCPECDKDWLKCIDYYVLGVHLEDIFLDSDTTEAHLAHWKERVAWFGGKPHGIKYKEIWHGERFSDLSFFWDTETNTLLPTTCPHCGNVLTTSEIQEAARPGSSSTDPVQLRCTECVVTFLHTPRFMQGNPLNQAFIFHEDGFNAFVKKSRGMATIQLCSACTFKDERSKGKYLSVYSFIPSCSIGEGIPHKLDAFLKPLMDDVVDLFINGKDIHIPHPIRIGDSLIPAGNHKVRMLLLLGTADIKGHAELTLYAGGTVSKLPFKFKHINI